MGHRRRRVRPFAATDSWRELIDVFAADEREFVRRTAFAMIAWSAVHRKSEPEATFVALLALIEAHATDDRNFVKKAVNWALRNIGKCSPALNAEAVACAERLACGEDKTARWIGKDALRELRSDRIRARLAAANGD